VFVGHALLAFALAVFLADRRDWPAERALTLGVVAGAFAALPDVDVAYALVAIDGGRLVGSADPEAFWDATRAVHRSMTHSLVVAIVAGPAFGFAAVRGTGARPRIARSIAAVVLGAIVAAAIVASGPLGGAVMGAFALVGAGIATLVRRRTALSPRLVAIAATGALLTHPWGDLTTGRPPRLAYPFEILPIEGRVVLHADPTIHLLEAFALELAVVWLAIAAAARVTDRSLGDLADRSAAIGAAYGIGAVVMIPPTLSVSYHFVFSILSVGCLCGALSWRRSPRVWASRSLIPSFRSVSRLPFATGSRRSDAVSTLAPRPRVPTADAAFGFAVTATTAITVALGCYAAVYAVFSP
jgi:membrane-bound metal-dependent hydrolase YbcI (DUF457 family)